MLHVLKAIAAPIALVFCLCAFAAAPVLAQVPTLPSGTKAVEVNNEAENIDKADVEALLKTLKDDAARQEFVSNLETLLETTEKKQSENGSSLATAMSDVVKGISGFLQDAVSRLSDTAVALTDVSSLVPALSKVAQDPEEILVFAQWIAIIGAVVAAGLVAAAIVTRILRRPIDRLESWVGKGGLVRTLACLVPLFLLRAVRALVFFAVTQAVLTTIDANNIQLAGRIFVLAVASHLICLALIRTLLLPTGLLSRSLDIPADTGAYLIIWANRLVATGIYGILGLQSGYMLGLPWATFLFLEKVIYGLLWALSVAFILQNRTVFGQTIVERSGGDLNKTLWSIVSATWHLVAIIYATAGLVILMSMGDAGFVRLGEIAALMIAIMLVWRLGWLAVDTLGRHAFSISREMTDKFPSLERRANRYVPHVLTGARVLISVIAVGAFLEVWGIQLTTFIASQNGQVLIQAIAAVIVIGGGAIIFIEVVSLFVERRLLVLEETGVLTGRERTLLPLIRRAVVILVGVLAVFIILSEIGIDITPLLAGASIIGLAIGFGAQSLVKDIISGVFLLIEDTLNVGDYVDVGGKTGTVEALSIRTLRLRDVAGDMHTIPFGTVDVITNMTKEYAYALVDVGVAYREDTDAVMKLLSEIGGELVEDENLKSSITGPFEVFGVQALADSSVNIRTRVKTVAGMQWAVRREFLRRVKRRFDAEGIEIPFPHQTLYFGESKDGTAPPAFVQVSEAKAKRGKKAGDETATAEEDFIETANPEMADAEAARQSEREAQEAERRRKEEANEQAAEEAKEAEEELAHDETPDRPDTDEKDGDKKDGVNAESRDKDSEKKRD